MRRHFHVDPVLHRGEQRRIFKYLNMTDIQIFVGLVKQRRNSVAQQSVRCACRNIRRSRAFDIRAQDILAFG